MNDYDINKETTGKRSAINLQTETYAIQGKTNDAIDILDLTIDVIEEINK